MGKLFGISDVARQESAKADPGFTIPVGFHDQLVVPLSSCLHYRSPTRLNR